MKLPATILAEVFKRPRQTSYIEGDVGIPLVARHSSQNSPRLSPRERPAVWLGEGNKGWELGRG